MTAPSTEAEILRMAGEGVSHREIARRLGNVSRTTVARVVKRHAERKPAAAIAERARKVRAHMAPPDPIAPPSAVDASAPAIDQVRALMADARAQLDAATAIGDSITAQRCTRNSAALASVLARLERIEHADSDVLRISRAQIDEAIAGVYARVEAMLDRPLVCAKCSRELSVEIAGVDAGDKGGAP